jgi:hypothetical protein
MEKFPKISSIIISSIKKLRRLTPEEKQIQQINEIAKIRIDKCNVYAQKLGLPVTKNTDHLYDSLVKCMENIEKNHFHINDWNTVQSDLTQYIKSIIRSKNISRWDTEKVKRFMEQNCKVIEKSRA